MLLLAAGLVWTVPADATQELCSIEPCCAMQAMDCCMIEEAPQTAPDLVLTVNSRLAAPVPVFSWFEVIEIGPMVEARSSETPSVAHSPPKRLALLSTYLI